MSRSGASAEAIRRQACAVHTTAGGLGEDAAAVIAAGAGRAADWGGGTRIVQEGIGYRKKEPVIRLYMEAYLGAPDTYDSIEI